MAGYTEKQGNLIFGEKIYSEKYMLILLYVYAFIILVSVVSPLNYDHELITKISQASSK